MLTTDRYPRCRAYLKAMHVSLDEPAMSDFWAAVILADAIPEEQLIEAGLDLGTGPVAQRDGGKMLGCIEGVLGRQKAKQIAHDDMESLKAFLGSRGVKVSKLPDEAAFWRVASILWPETVREGREGPLGELVGLIRTMTKKGRQAARQNIAKVPAEWRA